MSNRLAPHEQNGRLNPTKEFEGQSFRDFMAGSYEQDYFIEGLLVAGQPCVIAGSKKTLKRSVGLDLCISLAANEPFLGQFPISCCAKTGIMSGESGKVTIYETANRICSAKGIDPLNYLYPVMAFELPVLNEKTHLEGLHRFIEDHELDVIFIDPSYLCMPLGADAGNLFAVGALLAQITKLGERTGCTILLCHHNRKSTGQPHEPPELEDIAWAGFQEWARQWLLLGRRSGFRPDSNGEHELWMSVGGSAGHHGLWAVDVTEGKRSDPSGRIWNVSVNSASQAIQKNEDRQEQIKEEKERETVNRRKVKLIDVLKHKPDGETRSQLRALSGMNDTAFAPVLAELLQEGIIESCLVTKSNRQHDGFRLKQSSQTHSDSPRLFE